MILYEIIVLMCLLNAHPSTAIHFNCDSNPCANGKCTNLYRKTAYTCDCDPNWTGENCDTKTEKESDDVIIQDQSHDTNKSQAKDKKNNLDKGMNKNFKECQEKCAHKDIQLGNTCNYKESPVFKLQKTCQCQMLDKEHQHCEPLFDNFKLCQDDCQSSTNFAINETRKCFYYYNSAIKSCDCNSSSKLCSLQKTEGVKSSYEPEPAWVKHLYRFSGIFILVFVWACVKMRKLKNMRDGNI